MGGLIILNFFVIFALIVVWIIAAIAVAESAESKGKSLGTYVFLSILFSPLLIGFIVFFLVPNQDAIVKNEVNLLKARIKAKQIVEEQEQKEKEFLEKKTIADKERAIKNAVLAEKKEAERKVKEIKDEKQNMRDRL